MLGGIGAVRLRELTVPAVDSFLARVRRQKGTATAKSCRAVVSGVLSLAVRQGAIPTNPVRDVERLEGGRRKAPRALTAEAALDWLAKLEANALAVRRDLPDLTRFMLATGVRIGEALAVLWPEVDLEAATVEVNHTVIRVRRRGLIRKSTKSEAGERTLPLPSWGVRMLAERFASVADEDGLVFPDSLGGLRDPSNTAADFREARDAAGYDWVTSHVFRKTAATVMDRAGLSARAVADQLGHSRPSMTQDVYFGRKVIDRGGADALDAAFGNAVTDFGGLKEDDDLEEEDD